MLLFSLFIGSSSLAEENDSKIESFCKRRNINTSAQIWFNLRNRGKICINEKQALEESPKWIGSKKLVSGQCYTAEEYIEIQVEPVGQCIDFWKKFREAEPTIFVKAFDQCLVTGNGTPMEMEECSKVVLFIKREGSTWYAQREEERKAFDERQRQRELDKARTPHKDPLIDTHTEIRNLETQIFIYHHKNKKLPESLSDLQMHVEFEYDAFGNKYIYSTSSNCTSAWSREWLPDSDKKYEIISMGADGKKGGGDDISSCTMDE